MHSRAAIRLRINLAGLNRNGYAMNIGSGLFENLGVRNPILRACIPALLVVLYAADGVAAASIAGATYSDTLNSTTSMIKKARI